MLIKEHIKNKIKGFISRFHSHDNMGMTERPAPTPSETEGSETAEVQNEKDDVPGVSKQNTSDEQSASSSK